MALPVGTIIERRREALIAQWRQNPLIMVQVEAPAALPVLASLMIAGKTPASARSAGAARPIR